MNPRCQPPVRLFSILAGLFFLPIGFCPSVLNAQSSSDSAPGLELQLSSPQTSALGASRRRARHGSPSGRTSAFRLGWGEMEFILYAFKFLLLRVSTPADAPLRLTEERSLGHAKDTGDAEKQM